MALFAVSRPRATRPFVSPLPTSPERAKVLLRIIVQQGSQSSTCSYSESSVDGARFHLIGKITGSYEALCLAAAEYLSLQWSELTQLDVLTPYYASRTSLPQYSQSLTTLMLDNISVEDAILSTSLTESSTRNVPFPIPSIHHRK